MPKTKQSAALGSLSDFTSAPIPPQETDAERITALERRVATLEGLLSDVMMELDKAHSQPKAKQQVNGQPKPKQKPKQPKPQVSQEVQALQAMSYNDLILMFLADAPRSIVELKAVFLEKVERNLKKDKAKQRLEKLAEQGVVLETTDTDADGNPRWSIILVDGKIPELPAPKPKAPKAPKPPPNEMITQLLQASPHSRAEIEAKTGMDADAVKRCISWMCSNDLVEKTTEKDDAGNSRWTLPS